MTAKSYIHWPSERGSWHILGRVDDSGWFTRCGRNAGADARANDHLPWDERTCETCLRLDERDEARRA